MPRVLYRGTEIAATTHMWFLWIWREISRQNARAYKSCAHLFRPPLKSQNIAKTLTQY